METRGAQPEAQGKTGFFTGHRPRRLDWGIAAALGLLYLVLVMGTTSMGVTRDESFYIHYGKVYFNWFTRVKRADSPAEREELLSREGIKKVWKQNSEHPPLMKVLFGVSWKLFGTRLRDSTVHADGRVEIHGLGLAHGFEPGDEVTLLAPEPLGGDPDGRHRRIGRVVVDKRTTHKGAGHLLEPDDAAELAALCENAKEAPERYLVPCQVKACGPLGFLSETDAFRFPGALFGALLVFVLYLFGVEFGSRPTGLLAVLFFIFIPRAFFHAHLTAFDIPITALNLAVLYAFYRSLRSTGWAVATAFLWGLALLTKLNAFFIPITLLMWWGVANLGALRRTGRWNLRLPAFPLAFVLMPLLGLPMLFLFWPWLWYDTVESLGKYLAFHLEHEHYFQYYFGRAYQAPPFPVDFPFVLTLVTIPVVTLLLFGVGVWRAWLRPLPEWLRGRGPRLGDGDPRMERDWGRGWYVFINMLFPMALIATPKTPIFGGVKHWLLAFPFMALLAARAVEWLLASCDALWRRQGGGGGRWVRWGAGVVVAMVLLAPAVRDTLRFVPYGTAYYNEFIGGVRGAAEARMQRQFWSYASRGAFSYVNRHASAGSDVDFQDATRGTCTMAHLEGWLRDDLGCVTRTWAPPVLLFDVEERFTEEEMRYWKRMDTLGPVHEVAVDGVPMVRVYRKHAGLGAMHEQLDEE